MRYSIFSLVLHLMYTTFMFYPFSPVEILLTVLHYHWVLNEPYTLKLSTTVYHLNQKKKKGSTKESRERLNDHHCLPLSPSHKGYSDQKTDNFPEFHRHNFLCQQVLMPCCPFPRPEPSRDCHFIPCCVWNSPEGEETGGILGWMGSRSKKGNVEEVHSEQTM